MAATMPGLPAPLTRPLVNCTSHVIRIYVRRPSGDPEFDYIDIPESGGVARVREHRRQTAAIILDSSNCDAGREYSVRICESEFGEVIGLPDPKPNTIYLVSRVVCEALPSRRDLYFPDESIRDTIIGADNQPIRAILGCRCLSQTNESVPRTELNYAVKYKCRPLSSCQRTVSHRG